MRRWILSWIRCRIRAATTRYSQSHSLSLSSLFREGFSRLVLQSSEEHFFVRMAQFTACACDRQQQQRQSVAPWATICSLYLPKVHNIHRTPDCPCTAPVQRSSPEKIGAFREEYSSCLAPSTSLTGGFPSRRRHLPLVYDTRICQNDGEETAGWQ